MNCACGKVAVMEQAMRRLPLVWSLAPSCGQTATGHILVARRASGSALPRPVHSLVQSTRRSQPSSSVQQERTSISRHQNLPAQWSHRKDDGVHRPVLCLSPSCLSLRTRALWRRGGTPIRNPALSRGPHEVFLSGSRSFATKPKVGGGEAREGLLAHLNVRSRIAKVATREPIGGEAAEADEEGLVAVEMPPSDVPEEGTEVARSGSTSFVLPTNISHDRARVKSAAFVKSSADVSQCPPGNLPEFALVGRSNVGKSSLINMLVNRKELAQTSKKPGKTQLINHYLINNSWHLVDLPGYGYANAPTTVRTDWNNFTKDYFLKRDNLVAVCLLVDATIPPQPIDLECANWLGRNKIPLTIVFTKCDKRKKKKTGGRRPEENIKDFESQLTDFYAEPPPWVMTSSNNGTGKMELLVHLAQLRTFWRN